MSTGNGSADRHTVELLGDVRDELVRIARRAAERGTGRDVTRAFAAIVARLRSNPRAFGEPLYDLRHIRMQIWRGLVPPLYVEYGVHEVRPLVVIRRVVWLTDGGA